MTREEVKRRAELYSALAEGKTIQVQNPNGEEWFDVKIETLRSICEEFNYRIKSEPKYRPFKSQEECWNEMHKHPDFGWVVTKNCRAMHHIDSIHNALLIGYIGYSFDEMYQKFEFLDGTPFGVKEEE